MKKIKDISKVIYDKYKGSSVKIVCYNCGVETSHEILNSVDQEWSEIFDVIDNPVPLKTLSYRTLQCKGCEHISLQDITMTPNVVGEKGNFITKEEAHLYPPRIRGRKYLDGYEELPFNVLFIYEETYAALCHGLQILTGVGVRAIVETVCKQKNASGKYIYDKIDNLVELGVLTKSQAKSLHELRSLGNEAAHEVGAYDEQTLSTAMDIAENLLQNVYIIPQTTEKLKNRKK